MLVFLDDPQMAVLEMEVPDIVQVMSGHATPFAVHAELRACRDLTADCQTHGQSRLESLLRCTCPECR